MTKKLYIKAKLNKRKLFKYKDNIYISKYFKNYKSKRFNKSESKKEEERERIYDIKDIYRKNSDIKDDTLKEEEGEINFEFIDFNILLILIFQKMTKKIMS